MAEKTGISWTDYTFNPWMGCVKVSPGCKNCYAETLTKNRMGISVWGNNPRRRTSKANWKKPLKWNREVELTGKDKVFCGSLMDWAEDNVEVGLWRNELWEVILHTQNLNWQLLTKRLEFLIKNPPIAWPRNVWLGVSIENADYAYRADILRKIPAPIRFISYEPALGPLAPYVNLKGIDWVIYGGESGPGYRKEDKQWARDMRDKCRAEGVAFFHKQSAAFRNETGIELDGEIIHEFPTRYAPTHKEEVWSKS